jgi:hypothetical protein
MSRCRVDLRLRHPPHGSSPDIAAIPINDAHATFGVSVAWDARRDRPLVRSFIAFVEKHGEGARLRR